MRRTDIDRSGARRECFDDDPLLVDRNIDEVGSGCLEGSPHRKVAGILHGHDVAGLDEHLAGERRRLLYAARDQHVAGFDPRSARYR
jgi:hypothetical protein